MTKDIRFPHNRAALIILLLILSITITEAVQLCPVNKIPTEIKISHTQHPRNVITEGRTSINSINTTTTLLAYDPEGGRLPLIEKQILMSINVLETFYDPAEGTDEGALVRSDSEIAFPVTTEENGQVKIDITLPASINPRKVSYQIKANYAGDDNYVGSEKTERYVPGVIPLISLTSCFPIVLMIALLMGAMYSTGKNPFGYLDFSRFAFRVPRMKRGSRVIKTTQTDVTALATVARGLTLKAVIRLPSAVLGGAARVLSLADRISRRAGAAKRPAATAGPKGAKGKVPVQGKQALGAAAAAKAKDAGAELRKAGTIAPTRLGKMAAGLHALSVGYVRRFGAKIEFGTFSKKELIGMSKEEKAAAIRGRIKRASALGFKENILGTLQSLGWKPRAGKSGFLLNVLSTLSALAPKTSLWTASAARIARGRQRARWPKEKYIKVSERRRTEIVNTLKLINQELEKNKKEQIALAKIKFKRGLLTEGSRNEIISKVNNGLGTNLTLDHIPPNFFGSKAAMQQLYDKIQLRPLTPQQQAASRKILEERKPLKISVKTNVKLVVLKQLLDRMTEVMEKNARGENLSEKDRAMIGQSLASYVSGEAPMPSKQNLKRGLKPASDAMKKSIAWTIDQFYKDIVNAGFVDHKSTAGMGFDDKLKIAKSMFNITALSEQEFKSLPKGVYAAFTKRMRIYEAYVEQPVKLSVTVTPSAGGNFLVEALKIMQKEISYNEMQGLIPTSTIAKIMGGADIITDEQIKIGIQSETQELYKGTKNIPFEGTAYKITESDWERIAAGESTAVSVEKLKQMRDGGADLLTIRQMGQLLDNINEKRSEFLNGKIYARDMTKFVTPMSKSFEQDLFDFSRIQTIGQELHKELSETDKVSLIQGDIYSIASGNGSAVLEDAIEKRAVANRLLTEAQTAGATTEILEELKNQATISTQRIQVVKKAIDAEREHAKLPQTPFQEFSFEPEEVQNLLMAGMMSDEKRNKTLNTFVDSKTEGMTEPEKTLMRSYANNIANEGVKLTNFSEGLHGTLGDDVINHGLDEIRRSSQALAEKQNYETLLRAIKGEDKELGLEMFKSEDTDYAKQIEKNESDYRNKIKELNSVIKRYDREFQESGMDHYNYAIGSLDQLSSGQKLDKQTTDGLNKNFLNSWGTNTEMVQQAVSISNKKEPQSFSGSEAVEIKSYVSKSIAERERIRIPATLEDLVFDNKAGVIAITPPPIKSQQELSNIADKVMSGEQLTQKQKRTFDANLQFGITANDISELGKGKVTPNTAKFIVDYTKSKMESQNPIVDMRSNPEANDLETMRGRVQFANSSTREAALIPYIQASPKQAEKLELTLSKIKADLASIYKKRKEIKEQTRVNPSP